jgi:hypothetical protein
VSLFRTREPAEAPEVVRHREMRAKGIFDDLLNLEINVIVSPGMTARKMPDPWDAFAEIATSYTDLLVDFALEVQAAQATWRGPPVAILEEDRAGTNIQALGSASLVDEQGNLRALNRPGKLIGQDEQPSVATFGHLAARASEAWAVGCALVATSGWPQREKVNERVVLLKRIYRNCGQLLEILGSMPAGAEEGGPLARDIKMSAEHLMTLRKIWEVSINTVVMQTVVQLDGDIVTRIHAGHASASSSTLHQLHRESVASAMQNWQFLGTTLAQFLTSTLKRFL